MMFLHNTHYLDRLVQIQMSQKLTIIDPRGTRGARGGSTALV